MQKLELTWIGKEKQPHVEPRILLHDPSKQAGEVFNGGRQRPTRHPGIFLLESRAKVLLGASRHKEIDIRAIAKRLVEQLGLPDPATSRHDRKPRVCSGHLAYPPQLTYILFPTKELHLALPLNK